MRILYIGTWVSPSGVSGDLSMSNVLQDYDAVVVNPGNLETLYYRYADTNKLYRSEAKELLTTEAGTFVKKMNEKRSGEAKELLRLGGILVCFMQPLIDSWYEVNSGTGKRDYVTNYGWLGFEAPFDEYVENLESGCGETIDFIDQRPPICSLPEK